MAASSGTREPDPRKYVNTNRDGSHFHLYHDNTIVFDDGRSNGRGRYGNFMPPYDYQVTFACRDGSSFVFYPNGMASYDNGQGFQMFIPAGSYEWLPPVSRNGSNATSSAASVNGSIGSRGAAVTLWRPTPVPRRTTEIEEESSDDGLAEDGYDDEYKYGVRRRR